MKTIRCYMNQYKEQFDQYTSEHLLSMRAMGEELAEEAHLAIESIFIERRLVLPPRPIAPVIMADPANIKIKEYLRLAGSFLVFFMGVVAAKVLAQTWIAFAISACMLAYWIYGKTTSESKKNTLNAAKKADAENFNELMLKSAEGDIARVKDLVNYGADLNAQSKSGYTALMLAIRNNHSEIVEILLLAGADASLLTTKGTSALDVAKKNGQTALTTQISNSLKKST